MVDATQGVEAQTLANVFLALDNNLEIIPVLNKVDLPSADLDKTKREIEDVIGLDCSGAIPASAKTGVGVPEILEAIVAKVPPPKGDPAAKTRALIFDSWYDSYRGAVVMVRVMEGTLRKGQKIRFMATGRDYELTEMGIFAPHPIPLTELGPGEVGFLAANIKSVVDTKIGDTVTDAVHPSTEPLPGFKEVKPMVFAGIFPTDSVQYEDLRGRALQAQHERRRLRLRARQLGGARLRLPLRLPRAAPHGDHPGAPGARVQPGPHHHRAQRRLPLLPQRRLDEVDRQPGQAPGAQLHRPHRGADLPHDRPRARRLRGRGAGPLPGAAR